MMALTRVTWYPMQNRLVGPLICLASLYCYAQLARANCIDNTSPVSVIQNRNRSVEALILQNDVEFIQAFSKTDFKTWRNFQKKLADSSEKVKNLTILIQDQNFEISMGTREEIRESIVQFGFLNQHQTGSSMGKYDVVRRDALESSYLGWSVDQYRKLDCSIKPKYLILRPNRNSGLRDKTGGYGSGDRFISNGHKFQLD